MFDFLNLCIFFIINLVKPQLNFSLDFCQRIERFPRILNELLVGGVNLLKLEHLLVQLLLIALFVLQSLLFGDNILLQNVLERFMVSGFVLIRPWLRLVISNILFRLVVTK